MASGRKRQRDGQLARCPERGGHPAPVRCGYDFVFQRKSQKRGFRGKFLQNLLSHDPGSRSDDDDSPGGGDGTWGPGSLCVSTQGGAGLPSRPPRALSRVTGQRSPWPSSCLQMAREPFSGMILRIFNVRAELGCGSRGVAGSRQGLWEPGGPASSTLACAPGTLTGTQLWRLWSVRRLCPHPPPGPTTRLQTPPLHSQMRKQGGAEADRPHRGSGTPSEPPPPPPAVPGSPISQMLGKRGSNGARGRGLRRGPSPSHWPRAGRTCVPSPAPAEPP